MTIGQIIAQIFFSFFQNWKNLDYFYYLLPYESVMDNKIDPEN